MMDGWMMDGWIKSYFINVVKMAVLHLLDFFACWTSEDLPLMSEVTCLVRTSHLFICFYG